VRYQERWSRRPIRDGRRLDSTIPPHEALVPGSNVASPADIHQTFSLVGPSQPHARWHDGRVRLVVLGCSGGYPEPNRACSGYLVEAAGRRIWVDAGSGTLARMLAHCSLAEVDSAYLTHLHPDHWTDLPLAVHAIAVGAAERTEPLPVYGPHGWAKAVGVDLYWRGDDDVPIYEARELSDGLVIRRGETTIRTSAVVHGIETYAVRVEADGASLVYSADSAPCQALVDLARGADLFVCAAGTATASAILANPRQAGEMAAAAQARRLLLTHLPPGADHGHAEEAARTAFSGAVRAASEGAQYEVSLHD
jgi:ribonuclease BN (tRNA processing enzyme)